MILQYIIRLLASKSHSQIENGKRIGTYSRKAEPEARMLVNFNNQY